MLSAAYIKGKYYLCPNTTSEDFSKRSWNNITKLKKNSHGFRGIMLKKGQILKFGRYVFKINEISTEPESEKPGEQTEIDLDPGNNSKANKNLSTNHDMNRIDPRYIDVDDLQKISPNKKSKNLNPISEEGSKDSVCRICLSEDQSDYEDPLISP
jgi:hypothetical protein